MFHSINGIATGLTLVVLLVATAAFAQSDTANPTKANIENNADRLARKPRIYTGNPVTGREKSQLCQGCHGEFGNSTDPLIPKLAGQRREYIAKQIHNYQSGKRSHQIMNAMAATLTDEDLADIAAYFASQNKMKGDGSAENQRGKKLFLNRDPSKMRLACINCHGEKGSGIESPISAFPVIGGQHKDYIRQQLMNFRDGNRTNSPYNIMYMMAGSLTDAEIEALAKYVSVQPSEISARRIQVPVEHHDRVR